MTSDIWGLLKSNYQCRISDADEPVGAAPGADSFQALELEVAGIDLFAKREFSRLIGLQAPDEIAGRLIDCRRIERTQDSEVSRPGLRTAEAVCVHARNDADRNEPVAETVLPAFGSVGKPRVEAFRTLVAGAVDDRLVVGRDEPDADVLSKTIFTYCFIYRSLANKTHSHFPHDLNCQIFLFYFNNVSFLLPF